MSERARILWQTAAALTVAAMIALLAVLPAQYGYDPTGVGERLGLTGLAPVSSEVLRGEDAALFDDTVEFELLPFESVEYKYRLERGQVLLFTWEATDVVSFDLHAEPDAAEAGFAQSFAQGSSASGAGSYRAPFPGIHGWFWENRTSDAVKVRLLTSGFFSSATLYRDGTQRTREFGAGSTVTIE